MYNDSSNVDGLRRRTRLEVPAICIGLAVAYLGPNLQPIWVDAFIKDRVLTVEQTGWLASTELLLTAIAAITLPVRDTGYARRVAVAAASLVALANFLAIVPVLGILIAGRLLSGVGMGALLAAITPVATHRAGSQRVLALAAGAALLLSAVVFFLSPFFMGRPGLVRLFVFVAVIGAISVATASLGLPDPGLTLEESTHHRGKRIFPLLGCVAFASAAVGVNTAATYTVTIGSALGLDASRIGTALAVGTLLTIVGPAAAHVLGERFGLMKPLYVGLLVVGGSIFLLVTSSSQLLYGLSIAGLSAAMAFCMPYAITLVSRVDSSGRFASVAQGVAMLGTAAGPALGGMFASERRFHALAIVASAFVAFAILLFSLAGLGLRGQRTEARSGEGATRRRAASPVLHCER